MFTSLGPTVWKFEETHMKIMCCPTLTLVSLLFIFFSIFHVTCFGFGPRSGLQKSYVVDIHTWLCVSYDFHIIVKTTFSGLFIRSTCTNLEVLVPSSSARLKLTLLISKRLKMTLLIPTRPKMTLLISQRLDMILLVSKCLKMTFLISNMFRVFAQDHLVPAHVQNY